MKTILGLLALVLSTAANAGTCEAISGHFITQSCTLIHNGARFDDGAMEFNTNFNQTSGELSLDMTSRRYSLHYTVDGNSRSGRSQYEGSSYIATCVNNHLHIRAELGFKFPMLIDYTIDSAGKLIYQEFFEGDSSFVRICEMNRR